MARYVSPKKTEDRARHDAGYRFLLAVWDEAPEVVASLRNDVLPAYRQTFGLTATGQPSRRKNAPTPPFAARDKNVAETIMGSDTFLHWYHRARQNKDPAVRPLAKAIDRWAQTYHLTADWIVDTALRTVRAWETNPELVLQKRWIRKPISTPCVLTNDLITFRFNYHWPWEPTLEPRKDQAEKRILEACKQELKAHLDKIEELAKSKGYTKSSTTRQLDHYKWLVHAVVYRKSIRGLARKFKKDRSTIRDPVRRLGSLLDLPSVDE